MKERSNMIGKYIMTLLVLLMTAATAGAVTYLDDKTETCDSGPDYQNEAKGISGNRSISASRQRITLKKDGYWNTLCLPFLVTAEEVATTLAPTALKTLESSTFSGGTLTLNFEDAT